ncbi:MAG TPA: TonB-dependent receptor, partial [Bryobacteraceae bacterium]|nr:TonB-dependent receptor [Bryobacteraceae bacterium]
MSRKILLFLCACCAAAQTPDTAILQGQVLDPSHAAIPGAKITARNTQTGIERSAQTDSAGRFSIAGLPVAGAYDVTAVKNGFAEGHASGITLTGGATASIALELSVGEIGARVTVTGAAGEVETGQPDIGVRIESSQAEEMPLPNRRITYLPLLNAANRPAINQGDVFMNQNLFTTNGAGRRQTWFEVDGATDNDSWGRQTTFSTLPLLSLEEMTVLSSAFSAEYGGSTGSVVNIVTKPGGSEFHGEALEAWRPAATAAALSGFTP